MRDTWAERDTRSSVTDGRRGRSAGGEFVLGGGVDVARGGGVLEAEEVVEGAGAGADGVGLAQGGADVGLGDDGGIEQLFALGQVGGEGGGEGAAGAVAVAGADAVAGEGGEGRAVVEQVHGAILEVA